MNTLELTLQRKTDSGYPIIAALTRPGGFLPLRREGTLNLDIAALSELQYEPLAYGTALGQALFVDEIRDTFREGLSGGEVLRVLLSIEAPDLRALDWHRLAAPFDGRWRFLASQQNTPFSLSVPSPASSAHFPAIGRRDLRALLLIAGPESLSGDYKLAPFDVAATTASIQSALGEIPCDVLENPSLDALCAALAAAPYTLLHLVCHGAINQSGETILFFPKDSKGGPTPATDLLNRLSSLARLPHFVFLSACESALPQNGLGSLAQRLVRELGLPAVLAVTDRVSIATAGAIAAPFYAQLFEHGQPDLALAQSLAGQKDRPDLIVPALLSRLGGGPLFDDNTERALTEKELDFGLVKLAEALPERAPVMDGLRDSLTRRLRATLGGSYFSESSRIVRAQTISSLNSLSLEVLDLSFNALCLGQTPPAYDSRSPFRGLESFRPEDAATFFGREALTRKLVQKLNEHNFLAVLGASGSGKSSLVMAGLIPALSVPYAIFRPGAEPLAELDAALQAGPQLLVVDQFEELFTLSAREQRELCSDFISRLLEQSHRLRVIITLRADFLGEVAPFKSLKDEVQNHQEIIPPMDEAELRRAMEGQAGCAGLRFESDLSQQMLDDVSGEPGAMPLLQHALWTLWTRRHGRWLRADEYRAFGGVKQAIASTAEAVYARCTEFEKERLRDIFLRLTRLDDSADGRDTRRRVLLRDLIPAGSVSAESTRSEPAATTLLIKQLADARLVVVTGDEVEVAHEALIRHWERLRAWLNDDRDNLRLREDVTYDARRWENAGRDESLLNYRGARLELALAMSRNPNYRLNPIEQTYLDRCVGLREREKAATKQRRYTAMMLFIGQTVIIVILIWWGLAKNQNTIEQMNYLEATNWALQSTVEKIPQNAEKLPTVTPALSPSLTSTRVYETFTSTPSPNITNTNQVTNTTTSFTPPTLTITPQKSIFSLLEDAYVQKRESIILSLVTSLVTLLGGLLIVRAILLKRNSRLVRSNISTSYIISQVSKTLSEVPGLVRGAVFGEEYYKALNNHKEILRAGNIIYYGLPATNPSEVEILPEQNGDKLINLIADFLVENNAVLIKGDGGAGKTTLLARCAYLVANKKINQFHECIPIYIDSFSYKNDLVNTITTALKETYGLAIDQSMVNAQLEIGKLVIIFDGLSEIRSEKKQDAINEIIKMAQSATFKECYFLFSSRTELTTSIKVPTFCLLPLKPETATQLLLKYNLDNSKENWIKSQIAAFKEKPLDPLLFSMMIDQVKAKGPNEDLSETRSHLYENYFCTLLKIDRTSWNGWARAISEIANWLMIESGNRGIGLPREELIECLDSRFKYKEQNNFISYLANRQNFKIENVWALVEQLRLAGLLREEGMFVSFSQDTFEEFFAAQYLAWYTAMYKTWPELAKWKNDPERVLAFLKVIDYLKEIGNKEALRISVYPEDPKLVSELPKQWIKLLEIEK